MSQKRPRIHLITFLLLAACVAPPAPAATILPDAASSPFPPADTAAPPTPATPPTDPPPPTQTAPPPAPTPDPNHYTFAAIGDYGLDSAILDEVADLILSWNPAFIITLGDNNYPNGEASTIDENIGQYFHDFIYPYHGEFGDGSPDGVNRFFPVLGNHDWVAEGAQPYLDYFTLPGNERYYDFTWGPVHFFALDADTHEPDGVGVSSVQAQWLRAALAASTLPWQIVYMHQPPFSSGHHGSTDYIQWPFAEWGADAVLAGHDHSYERLIIDGIPYIVNGLGGHINRYYFFQHLPGSQVQYRAAHGALRVTVSPEALTFEMITAAGETVDTHQITSATGAPAGGSDPVGVSRLPDPALFQWQPFAAGYNSPILLTPAADGTGRLFVVEQAGLIRIIGQDAPFLDLTGRVGSSGNEQGLLGLAFAPDYETSGCFYVNYTNLQGNTIISRFTVLPGNPASADPASETILLNVAQPYPNHNGGHLAFAPDGRLFIGLGDGGSGGDPEGHAQNLASLLGKMLALDVESGGVEIVAAGLRNPWRYAFDALTGDLYIADVGQGQWEEVNFWAAGTGGMPNFGWNYFEGMHPYTGSAPPGVSLVPPVAEYSHAEGCSITGGEVYRGSALPDFYGVYLYGDFCSGNVWGLVRDASGVWTAARLFQLEAQITSFGLDETGEVYLVSRQGVIYKLVGK
jgi:glucose/arabinose dehydrogenase